MKRLLVVDDEPRVIDVVRPYLEDEGFAVLTAHDGREALRRTADSRPDLVVLDWMLPGMNGLDVCRELRRTGPKIGIIMLTAKADEADKVTGLEVGADDYLEKPFSLRELTARIRSLLRRMEDDRPESTLLRCRDLTLDEERYRVTRAGQELSLTPTEFKILATLMRRPGVVHSRLQLLKAAMGHEYLNYERTIDTHVSHVRQKLEEGIAAPPYIETVYGIGYRMGENE